MGNSPRIRRTFQGGVLGIGAPLGWLAVRVFTLQLPVSEALALEPWLYAYLTLGSVSAFAIFGYRLGRAESRLASTNLLLTSLSMTDGLTGLPNRRAFDDAFERAFSFADRSGTPLSLLVLDIDHFKDVNDTYGHSAGDEVLRQLARVLETGRRRQDFIARVGGEEFAVLLPGADASTGADLAERIRRNVENGVFLWQGKKLPIRISLGVAEGSPAMNPAELYRNADSALYEAKRTGRNRVAVSGAELQLSAVAE